MVCKKCIECGEKTCRVKKSAAERKDWNYCSRACAFKSKKRSFKISETKKTGKFFNCLICFESFWRDQCSIKKGNNKFCSRVCYFVWQKGREKLGLRGEKHYKWKGGVGSINNQIRASLKYKLWRNGIFKRDNWTCRRCGARSMSGNPLKIEAHHIKSFALFPKLRFDSNNGITLCKSCHTKEPEHKSSIRNRRNPLKAPYG